MGSGRGSQRKAVGGRKRSHDQADAFSATAAEMKRRSRQYVLKLFVTGNSPQSGRAIENLRRICEDYLKGRYRLEVVDVYQQPLLAIQEQIVASPTLIKKLPLPLRRIIGDLSSESRVLAGLDIVGPKLGQTGSPGGSAG